MGKRRTPIATMEVSFPDLIAFEKNARACLGAADSKSFEAALVTLHELDKQLKALKPSLQYAETLNALHAQEKKARSKGRMEGFEAIYEYWLKTVLPTCQPFVDYALATDDKKLGRVMDELLVAYEKAIHNTHSSMRYPENHSLPVGHPLADTMKLGISYMARGASLYAPEDAPERETLTAALDKCDIGALGVSGLLRGGRYAMRPSLTIPYVRRKDELNYAKKFAEGSREVIAWHERNLTFMDNKEDSADGCFFSNMKTLIVNLRQKDTQDLISSLETELPKCSDHISVELVKTLFPDEAMQRRGVMTRG